MNLKCVVITSFKIEDTSHSPYLDGRKPDITLLPCDYDTCSTTTATVVGEIKSKQKSKFTSEAQGEVLTWAHRLLKVQPYRNKATVFLTNCHMIQFFQVIREGNTLQHKWTAPEPLYTCSTGRRGHKKYGVGTGGKYLLALLATDPTDESMYSSFICILYFTFSLPAIGFRPVPRPKFQKPILLSEYLGWGATSIVCATNDGRVVKFVKEKFATACKNEFKVLQKLNHARLTKIQTQTQTQKHTYIYILFQGNLTYTFITVSQKSKNMTKRIMHFFSLTKDNP
jgi:hypothetical protein